MQVGTINWELNLPGFTDNSNTDNHNRWSVYEIKITEAGTECSPNTHTHMYTHTHTPHTHGVRIVQSPDSSPVTLHQEPFLQVGEGLEPTELSSFDSCEVVVVKIPTNRRGIACTTS